MNVEDVLSVDVTPLSSISTSGPDMSMAKSVSVDPGTSMSVDFDDRDREIQDTAAAMLELADTAGASRRFRNPSHYRTAGRQEGQLLFSYADTILLPWILASNPD